MLATYIEQQVPVTIVLQNRFRVSGTVKAFDSYVILLEGQKSEIIYRHAVSSLAPAATARPARPAPTPGDRPKTAPRPERQTARTAPRRKGPKQPAAAPAADASINTGMKEGLLRWMQERKASK
jgi:host factor-I protein